VWLARGERIAITRRGQPVVVLRHPSGPVGRKFVEAMAAFGRKRGLGGLSVR
jgi:antitoxin (DNA-binding transcriptional repressor) of toxin-antitoxin stability system